MILLVILVYSILIIYEFIPLYKQKLWRELWVNGLLGTLSFAAAVMLSIGVDIPSPAKPIENMITSIFGK